MNWIRGILPLFLLAFVVFGVLVFLEDVEVAMRGFLREKPQRAWFTLPESITADVGAIVCVMDVDNHHLGMFLNTAISMEPFCDHFLAVPLELGVINHLRKHNIPFVFSEDLVLEVKRNMSKGVLPSYLALHDLENLSSPRIVANGYGCVAVRHRCVLFPLLEPTRNEYEVYATKAKSVLSGMTRTEQDLRI